MSLTLTPLFFGFLLVIVLGAGAVNGIAGFGFAVVGTLLLASLIDPATAVVLMILPILSVNLALTRELSIVELQSCVSRFLPLLLAAVIGTVIGMFLLDSLPGAPLRVALGIVALGFVANAQQRVRIPGLGRIKQRCFVNSLPAMIGVGGLAGALFGGTNVGVQLVAYIRSFHLSHTTFIGVVAIVFLGMNAVRVVAAAAFGLYSDPNVIGISVISIVPAIAGVWLGMQVRQSLDSRVRVIAVLGLIAIIGARLVLSGLGIA